MFSQMLRILLGLFLLQPLVVDAEKSTHLTRELERLTKVLPRDVVKHPDQFHADFHNDAGRLNVSIEKYADTCFDSYLSMHLSPAESGVWNEMLAAISGNYTERKQIAETWEEALPLTHSALAFRRRALERMADNATLPETAAFVKIVADIIEPTFHAFLMGTMERRNILKSTITKIALIYKELSREAKLDLERALCFRNAMRWINATVGASKSQLFDRFWEVEGVNVDGLLKTSDLYSTLAIDRIKEVTKHRAAKFNMAPQDYVDNCAESINVLMPNGDDEDILQMTGEELLGSEFGQYHFDTTNEMIDNLFNESAPFLSFIEKRYPFVDGKLKHLTPKTRAIWRKVEGELTLGLLQINNVMATTSLADKSFQSISSKTTTMWHALNQLKNKSVIRELERVFCVEMMIESLAFEFVRNFDGTVSSRMSRSGVFDAEAAKDLFGH